LSEVIDETDIESQKKMVRSEDSFNLWQSILRGAGAVIGCRRCQDVCPVGEDYETMLKDAVDEISEDTPEKQIRLKEMISNNSEGNYLAQSRWVGIMEK
jgi:epoxyqueuosine reductase